MNCSATCVGCHFHFHVNPEQHTAWMVERYGQTDVDLLQIKANDVFRGDLTFIEMWINKELKKYLPKYPV